MLHRSDPASVHAGPAMILRVFQFDEDGCRLAVGSDDLDGEIEALYRRRETLLMTTGECLEADSEDIIDEVREEVSEDGGGEFEVHS